MLSLSSKLIAVFGLTFKVDGSVIPLNTWDLTLRYFINVPVGIVALILSKKLFACAESTVILSL